LILITGAGGKTGRALLKQLGQRGQPVRALVRYPSHVKEALTHGAAEAIAADLLDPVSLKPAFQGIEAVYHIPPNVHPGEEVIAENILHFAGQQAIAHFVYHSVLRPYIRAMPHHIKKARVEERLFTSGIPFTILQPAAYMQNTLPGLDTARTEGVFKVPYPIDTPLGMVDLDEVGEVGAKIILNLDHDGATYELAGAERLTPAEVAEHMGAFMGKPVVAQQVDLKAWRNQAVQGGMSSYEVATLIKMFRYYARHGFWGNPHTLTSLLGRPPKTYAEFLASVANA
jgi:NAD(P)H dehydrogenase (quinone)